MRFPKLDKTDDNYEEVRLYTGHSLEAGRGQCNYSIRICAMFLERAGDKVS